MAYVRHNTDNSVTSPQPTATTVTVFGGTEGWSTIVYKDWNGDYVPKDYNNTTRTPGVFQARSYDNTTRTPGSYQRYDGTNNPILA
jgi:hypothetical protein